MADSILKDGTGKIWVNGAGKVLKAKKFSEIPIQDGLAFWGQADPVLLTQIDGLVSEAYDVRDGYGGARKMVQNTVAKRLTYNAGYIYGTLIDQYLGKVSENMRSAFIIMKSPSNTSSITGIGVNSAYFECLGLYNQNSVFQALSVDKTYYKNNIKYTTSNGISNNQLYILSTVTDFNKINLEVRVGATNTAHYPYRYIYEWGWYNRPLSETEIIYNINCLNQKYAIF